LHTAQISEKVWSCQVLERHRILGSLN
jgi:hypothetical protein